MMQETILVEHVTHEMEAKTTAKLLAWDSVIEENLLADGTEEDLAYAYGLLEDPMIYAYAFFRDPRDLSKPFITYPYQDVILNDPTLKGVGGRVIFDAANQIGKSVTLCILALHCAIMNPGKTYIMVSLTLPQAKDLLKQIKYFLTTSSVEYKYDIGDTETKTEIYIRHYEEYEEYDEELQKNFTKQRELPQSRIICIPATGAALGYPVDGMFIDELAFQENGEWFYKQVAQPRTYHTKGFIIVFSNPNGQQGIFWDLWNSPRFNKYKFNFLDCPANTQEEFDLIASELTQEQIDSTLLAIFTSPEGGFITLDERRKMQEDRANLLPSTLTQPVYIFYDFAKAKDRTVRVIGIPYSINGKNGVYIYEMKEYPQGTPYNEIVEELVNLSGVIGAGNIAMVGWDNTGVGRGIEDFLKRIEELGILCNPVEFSLENKSAIYTLFKLLIERNTRGEAGIKIPTVPECDKQLAKLRFNKSSRGYLQIHHEKESDRDDYPDALAGLCSLVVQPENVPITATIIGDDDDFIDEENDDELLGFA